MGGDPASSVVNKQCESHDHPNSLIAGTSVMPSASCMNPPLTGAALSLRLRLRLRLADSMLYTVKV